MTANLVTTFLNKNQEDADYNQYWYFISFSSDSSFILYMIFRYSQYTIAKIVEDIKFQMNQDASVRVGFLSTPSLYFSLEENYRERSFVFDVRIIHTNIYWKYINGILCQSSMTRNGKVIADFFSTT